MAKYKPKYKNSEGQILDLDILAADSTRLNNQTSNYYLNIETNQEISGQKDFNTVPRVKITHETHDLPSDYEELEYIESTGTQYINTGITLTNNHSIEIDYQLTNINQPKTGIFGGYSTSRYGAIIDTNNVLEYGYGSTNHYYKTNTITLTRHIFKQEKNTLYIDGDLIYTFTAATFTLNVNCPIGTFAYTNYAAAKAKYYNAKIWNDATLVRNYIPAKNKTTEKVGMYDIVNNQFYESAVTDNFIVGPTIQPITYENVLTDANFAAVAFSGDYSDLTNKPTNLNQFVNGPGYVTSAYHDSTKANQSEVNTIQSKIPSAATSSNQLADKAFVNSSIETATATFRGTFDSLETLQSTSGDLNDYTFYRHTDSVGNTLFDRYKYTSGTPHWVYEYTLNNSSFTAAQWAAINSGVSVNAWVDRITAQTIDGQKDFEVVPRVKVTHQTHNLPETYQEVEYLESSGTQFIDSGYVPNGNSKVIFDSILGIGTASSDIRQGRHADGQRLSIALVTSKLEFAIGGYLSVNYNTINQRHTYELDVSSRQGKMDGTTLATFNASSWTSQQTLYFFARHMSSGQDGLGNVRNYSIEVYEQGQLIRQYIPCYRKSDDESGMYDTVNDVFYTNIGTGTFIVGPDIYPIAYESLLTDASFATVAKSGNYNDLLNKPTIPTVNNSTITIKQNGISDQTFTLNGSAKTITLVDTTYSNATTTDAGLMSASDKTKLNNIASGAEVNVQSDWNVSDSTSDAYIKNKPTIPTKTSDLNNDSGFITNTVNDLTNYTPTSSLAVVATSGDYTDLSNTPTNLVTTNTQQNITERKRFDIVPQTYVSGGKNLFVHSFSIFTNTGGTGSVYAYFKLPNDGKNYTLSVRLKDNTKSFGNDNVFGWTVNGGNFDNLGGWLVQGDTIKTEKHVFYANDAGRCISMFAKTDAVFNKLLDRYYIQLEEGTEMTVYEEPGQIVSGYYNVVNVSQLPTKTSDLTNDSNFITLNDVPKELYWCTYGTTTYTEITAAITAGKLPVCKYSSHIYIYNVDEYSVGHIFALVKAGGTSNGSIIRVVCDINNSWARYSVTLEAQNNKVTSISSSSTNTQYPGAKCVYDELQLKQNTLTFDSVPTDGSSNPVTSDGIFDTIQSVRSDIPTSVVQYVSQSLSEGQKTQARTNIGAGTSNFTGYTATNKLSTDYINNVANWTNNEGTVIGSGLTSDKIVIGNSGVNITVSNYSVNDIKNIAEGKTASYVIATKSCITGTEDSQTGTYTNVTQILTAPSGGETLDLSKINVGDNIYVLATNVPDYWVFEKTTTNNVTTLGLSILETTKVSIGTLNTTETTSQTTSSSESLSGNIKLHKISKTGKYDDLINKPDIPDNTDYVDLSTNQVISGQKDFDIVPRVKVGGESPREGLPTETYTQLQYVESDGSQYIDTTYTINTATDTVEIVFECVGTTIYKWLFGEHDNNARFGLGVGDGTNKRNVAYGASTYKVNDTLFYNQLHYFKADSTGVFIDSTKIADYSNFNSTSSLALFCLNYGGFVNGTTARIQSYKHIRNNIALIDLVPVVRNNDNKAGFYDFVSENFIGSATSTELSAGPELPGPHYEDLLTDANFASVAFSGSYNDLTNLPTIPTVNNATLTIQKNGTTVNTFTANASSNVTANITVPVNDSDLTNNRYVRYDINNQNLTSTQKDNVRTNIGAGTSSFSGSYNDLTNKPTIPTLATTSTANKILVSTSTSGTNKWSDNSVWSGNAGFLKVDSNGITSVDTNSYQTINTFLTAIINAPLTTLTNTDYVIGIQNDAVGLISGSVAIANPTGTPTSTLNKLKVGNTIYNTGIEIIDLT